MESNTLLHMRWVHDSAAASAKRTEIRRAAPACWSCMRVLDRASGESLRKRKLSIGGVHHVQFREPAFSLGKTTTFGLNRVIHVGRTVHAKTRRGAPNGGPLPPTSHPTHVKAQEKKLLKLNPSFSELRLAIFVRCYRVFSRCRIQVTCFAYLGPSWCRI